MMGILKMMEWMMGKYKYKVPILKMRAGQNPVWFFDYAKRVRMKQKVYYELYKTPAPDNRFPPPRAEEIFIDNKGRDVFPKILLDDGAFAPLSFDLAEETMYFCQACKTEFKDPNDAVTHLESCKVIEEIENGKKNRAKT